MSNSRDSSLIHYQYDALDRLVSCTPAGQPRLDRLYQKDRLTTEIQGSIQRQIFQCADLLLAELRQEGIQRTSLLMTDKQRSVLQTSDGKSAYTPYGHRPAEGGLTSLLGFNGQRRDPITGHYLLGNGHRAFNPVLMRFNSPDSLSPFGNGGLNCYAYCQGDPVNRSDPTGRSWYADAWFTKGVIDFISDYLLPRAPKQLARRIPVVASTGFGRASKAMAAVSGLSATVLYLVMNRVENAHPDSQANDPLFYAFLTTAAVAFLSGTGVALHKLARPSKVLTRRHSLPNMRRSFGGNINNSSATSVPMSGQNGMPPPSMSQSQSPPKTIRARLREYQMRRRFDRGDFRPKPVAPDSASIRRPD